MTFIKLLFEFPICYWSPSQNKIVSVYKFLFDINHNVTKSLVNLISKLKTVKKFYKT